MRDMKYMVLGAFVAIVGSLGAALVFMMRGQSSEGDSSKSRRMAWALAARVGFSVLLFLAILLSYHMGWIQPTGLPAR